MAGIGHRGFMGRKKEPVGLPFIFSVTVGNGESFQLPTVNGGTYDCLIEWGDTTSNTLTVWNDSGRSHTYAVGGTYDIKISGVFNGWSVNNYADRLKITEVKQWGILIISGIRAFWGCSNLTVTATDILDMSNETNLTLWFANCTSLTDIPNIHLWDISNVSVCSQVFNNTNITGAGLDLWNTSSFTNIDRMFSLCSNFNTNLNSWDTSNIDNMDGTFGGCTAYNQPMDNWDVSNVSIFGGAGNRGFLWNCVNFNQNLNTWQFKTTGTVNIQRMFQGCTAYNQPMGNWNTERFVSTFAAFSGCTSLDQDFSDWDVTLLTNASNMFSGVTLSTANYDALLISWAAQSVQSGVIAGMGSSEYTSGGAAEAARNTLINTYGWSITDGGAA